MSSVADMIRLKHMPVAIYRAAAIPEGARVPSSGRCSVPPLFLLASKGHMTAAAKLDVKCHGALSGFGFGGIADRKRVALKMSANPEEHADGLGHGGGRREFDRPETAMLQLDALPDYGDGEDCIVFEPYDNAKRRRASTEVVAVLADPFEISALFGLAGYSRRAPGPAAVLQHGHACEQIYSIPRKEGESDEPRAVIGMTDLFARRFVDRDLLSFAAPYQLWERMEFDAPHSFLSTERWERIIAENDNKG